MGGKSKRMLNYNGNTCDAEPIHDLACLQQFLLGICFSLLRLYEGDITLGGKINLNDFIDTTKPKKSATAVAVTLSL